MSAVRGRVSRPPSGAGKADPPKGEVSLKAEGESGEPNIVQQAKVKSKAL